jgi:hypothetical protein
MPSFQSFAYSLTQFLVLLSSTRAAPQGSSGNIPSNPTTVLPFAVGADGPAAPVVFPLSNGFPTVVNNTPAYHDLVVQSHGSLSNAPPPAHLAEDDIRSLKFIQMFETFEVYLTTQFLLNMTNNVPGFEIDDLETKAGLLSKFIVIQGQEQYHALQAGGLLQHFNISQIEPCLYKTPAIDFQSAIRLLSNVTMVVICTLQDISLKFAQNGDSGVVRNVGSILGQEGGQAGAYRYIDDLVPAAQPLLTQSTRDFAYSYLQQNYIVPGSCPNDETVDIPIFGVLDVLTENIQQADQNLTFSIPRNSTVGLSLVFINGQNLPIVQNITDAVTSNGVTTFSAEFPYTAHQLDGLTIAAVTNSTGPFTTANDVANKTMYGPGIIYFN